MERSKHPQQLIRTKLEYEGEESIEGVGPNMLIVQLVRDTRNKDVVNFPEHGLHFGGRSYSLHAVMYHRAFTGNETRGHYVASVKDAASGRFFNYDDGLVTPVTSSLVPSAGTRDKETILVYLADQ